jgi:hypothetical protein
MWLILDISIVTLVQSSFECPILVESHHTLLLAFFLVHMYLNGIIGKAFFSLLITVKQVVGCSLPHSFELKHGVSGW